jgi:hypothetical protein
MAASFLILRFVIPLPDNTELTVTALEASLGSCRGMEMGWAKRFMIRPFVALRFQLDWACLLQPFGCGWVADFAGLVRNLPM